MKAITSWYTDKYKRKVLRRIFFTLFAVVVFRIGTHIVVPYTNEEAAKKLFDTALYKENVFAQFIDMFGGGGLKQFSIFALSVTPYITASIIIQLLQMDVLPILTRWSKEGVEGRKKTNMTTRVLSIVLAFIQGISISILFSQQGTGLITVPAGAEWYSPQGFMPYVTVSLFLTAGTAFLLWLGDQITKKGIGNGVSVLIMAGIASTLPASFRTLYKTYLPGTFAVQNATTEQWSLGFNAEQFKNAFHWDKFFILAAILVLFIALVMLIVIVQDAVRRVPLQQANSTSREVKNTLTFLPMKINSAGVIPIIFASSMLTLPLTVATFFRDQEWSKWVLENLVYNSQTKPWSVGFFVYIALVVLFTFFYAYVQLNPEKMTENFGKQGTYIPGVRPGMDTEQYITRTLMRLTILGALFMMIIAALPELLMWTLSLPSSVQIGGTSIIIVAGVALEISKQVRQQLKQQQYKNLYELYAD
ncbi:MAG: preprotein translocase subunit SecY [Culicoidibacterales bacterium]